VAYEDDEYDMPSVPRRKGRTLSKGVVLIPPERMRRDKKREKPTVQKPTPSPVSVPEKKPKKPERPKLSLKAKLPTSNVLTIIAAVIAVLALIFSLSSMLAISGMKAEIGSISEDLRAYRKATITIQTTLDAEHKVDTSLPISEGVQPFSIPIPPQQIAGTGSFNVILPGLNIPVSIPWNGTIFVEGSVDVNTTAFEDDKILKLSYTLPGEGRLTMNIKGEDLFTPELASINDRLDRLSK